jgi:uncharacterized protein (TIGR02145 family)
MAEKSVRIPKMNHKGGKRGQKQEGLIQKPTSWVRTSWVLGRKTVACERFAMRSLVVKYGRLYNGHAVVDARGLCPSGWHVPSTGEWALLTDHLGGSSAVQMKTTYGWVHGGNGTNSGGFSGLPGGFRNQGFGTFDAAGEKGYWWSSTPASSSNMYRFRMEHQFDYPAISFVPNENGFSVRCVHDTE